MAKEGKIKVAVVQGGRSGEHEVSLRSARSIIENIDASRFDVLTIFINHDGEWSIEGKKVFLHPYPSKDSKATFQEFDSGIQHRVDVIFPAVHGTFCEDGSLQGLFELAEAAYVGSGVAASAVGMDKELAKRLVADKGIPIVPYITIFDSSEKTQNQIQSQIGFPCFVKPAGSGSSVGVHKVKRPEELKAAIEDALLYDTKVLVEKSINAREIEIAILQNEDPLQKPIASIVGEIRPKHEFYSYEAKYLDENGAELIIPAPLTDSEANKIQQMAISIFHAIGCEGHARVDLFLDRNDGRLYFNEINTLPGFTSISMYPKLMAASGIGYSDLLTRLILLAIARQKRRKKLQRFFPGAKSQAS
jgi:D-alanine-D-alanine ligase